MKGIKIILLLFIIAIAIMPSVAASYISIQSTVTAADNKTTIKVTNLGDEAAYNVQLSLEANSQKTASSIKKQLGVRESFEWNVPLAFKPKNPGKYPLILTANYEDANSYPFSAISVSTFDYKQATISDIAAKISNLELSDKGTLELKIKNTAETAKDVNIKLIVPKELTANKDKLSAKLPAKSEMSADFEIEKFSALTGSSYAVFAVVEYDEDGKHYTSIANGAVTIMEKQRINISSTFLLATLAILVITFAILQVNSWKKNKV